MFSRRHPYLFFLLIFSTVVAITVLGLSLVIVFSPKRNEFSTGKNQVGIIEIKGVVSDSKNIIENIKRFRDEKSIKAIVLRIDSPGGAVGPAQEIYREVRKASQKKPIIASLGTVAASGGYYIAAGADSIIANPGTITGSIGVIMGFTNFQEVLRKIGLVPVVIKSGTFKDMGSPVREMTTQEREILQNLADKIHAQFVRDVALGRKMEKEILAPLADGRIFTGEEAKDLGLVDRIGNLEDSIEWAGRKGGIEGKIAVVYAPEKRFSLIKYVLGTLLGRISELMLSSEYFSDYYSPASTPLALYSAHP